MHTVSSTMLFQVFLHPSFSILKYQDCRQSLHHGDHTKINSSISFSSMCQLNLTCEIYHTMHFSRAFFFSFWKVWVPWNEQQGFKGVPPPSSTHSHTHIHTNKKARYKIMHQTLKPKKTLNHMAVYIIEVMQVKIGYESISQGI